MWHNLRFRKLSFFSCFYKLNIPLLSLPRPDSFLNVSILSTHINLYLKHTSDNPVVNLTETTTAIITIIRWKIRSRTTKLILIILLIILNRNHCVATLQIFSFVCHHSKKFGSYYLRLLRNYKKTQERDTSHCLRQLFLPCFFLFSGQFILCRWKRWCIFCDTFEGYSLERLAT